MRYTGKCTPNRNQILQAGNPPEPMAKHLKANGRKDRIENNWEVLMVH